MISARLANSWYVAKTLTFSDTINIIDVKLCMIVVHIDTISMTLILFQGHSSIKQF